MTPPTEGGDVWRYQVDCSDTTDYETGEHIAYWDWSIFRGPTDPDDLVLYGQTDQGDPTAILSAIVIDHNGWHHPTEVEP